MLALPVFAGPPIDEQMPEAEPGQDVSAAQRLRIFEPGQEWLLVCNSRGEFTEVDGNDMNWIDFRSEIVLTTSTAQAPDKVRMTVACRRMIGRLGNNDEEYEVIDTDDPDADDEIVVVQELTFVATMDGNGRLTSFAADEDTLTALREEFADADEGEWWIAAFTQMYRAAVEGAMAYLPPISAEPGDTYTVDPRMILEIVLLPSVDEIGFADMDEQAICTVQSVGAVDDVVIAEISIDSTLTPTTDETLMGVPDESRYGGGYLLTHQGAAQVDVDTGQRVSVAMTIQGVPVDADEGAQFTLTADLLLRPLDVADAEDAEAAEE